MDSKPISNERVLQEIGMRIARHRLNMNQTQAALAREAGVSLPTIQRIEKGHSTQLTNLLRVLRALKLDRNWEVLIPEPAVSPMQTLKMQGKKRLRASNVIKEPNDEGWVWGDEK